MKKQKKIIPPDLLEKAEIAMIEEESVYCMDMEGKQRVEAQIIQIDHDNPEYTFLLRFSKLAMKWVGFDQITF